METSVSVSGKPIDFPTRYTVRNRCTRQYPHVPALITDRPPSESSAMLILQLTSA